MPSLFSTITILVPPYLQPLVSEASESNSFKSRLPALKVILLRMICTACTERHAVMTCGEKVMVLPHVGLPKMVSRT